MRHVVITPDMERVFRVTHATDKNFEAFFLKEENIYLWFEDAVWLGYANAKSTYIINGVYLKQDEIDTLGKENQIFEITHPEFMDSEYVSKLGGSK